MAVFNVKKKLARLSLFVSDLALIFIAIVFAFALRQWCDCFERSAPDDVIVYMKFELLYVILIVLLYKEGIYTKRYDFWQESERILKAVVLSAVIVFAVLAMSKNSDSFSRFIIIFTFLILIVLLPLQKYVMKQLLFRIGWWKHEALVVGEDPFFEEHVFTNPYLGYVRSTREMARTLFVSSSHSKKEIEGILHDALIQKQTVLFIPAVKNFDFSDAHIVHLFNARANLIMVENNLMHTFNRRIKSAIDYLLALLLLPVLTLIIGMIAWRIKYEDGGAVFFKQVRLGQDGKTFECYKFRSMSVESEGMLCRYLEKHPEEKIHYERFHKYQNDPRITRIGRFLRKTSLDELPQIINVLQGEMSLIGPRPYMPNEQEKMGENIDMILAVKPGITGLWQVSGRSDVDFTGRVEMDVWYVRNWSVWNDLIILIKTVQVVLKSKGSY